MNRRYEYIRGEQSIIFIYYFSPQSNKLLQDTTSFLDSNFPIITNDDIYANQQERGTNLSPQAATRNQQSSKDNSTTSSQATKTTTASTVTDIDHTASLDMSRHLPGTEMRTSAPPERQEGGYNP